MTTCSKREAEKLYQNLVSKNNKYEFIVLYKGLLGAKYFYKCSNTLLPKFTDKQGYLATSVLNIIEGKLYFLCSDEQVSYDAIVIEYRLLTLIYVEYDKKVDLPSLDEVTEWFANITGSFKDVATLSNGVSKLLAALAGLVVACLSSLPFIPKETVPKQVIAKTPLEILHDGYYNLPNPQSNGLLLWKYTNNCTRRSFIEMYSPFLQRSAFDTIKDVSSSVGYSFTIKEKHLKGESAILYYEDLDDSQTKYIWDNYGVKSVVAVPIESTKKGACPDAYLTSGYTQRLTEANYRQIEESMKEIADTLVGFDE